MSKYSMSLILILILLLTVALTTGGCFDTRRMGADLVAGATQQLESYVDEKLQASLPEIEKRIDDANVMITEEAKRRGIPMEYAVIISAIITAMAERFSNWFRNRKYTELTFWQKLFTAGARS